MANAFVQLIGSSQSKAAGTSIDAIPTGSVTVTAGNDIFVAFASDDAGSSFSVVDDLGNTYTLVKETVNAGNVKSQLWRATNITGGTLSSVIVSWTTNVTAKAVVAAEFSGVGTLDLTDGFTGNSFINNMVVQRNVDQGDLGIGAAGWEDTNNTNYDGVNDTIWGGDGISIEVAQNGTTGGGAASNITVQLIYGIATQGSATGSLRSQDTGANSHDYAGAGAVYSPAAAAAPPKSKSRVFSKALGRASRW